MSGALLGAAATALTVKSALTGPLAAAAQAPWDDATQRLGKVQEAALSASWHAINEKHSGLQRAVTYVGRSATVPTTSAPKPTPATTPTPRGSNLPNASDSGAPSSDAPNHAHRTDGSASIRKLLTDAAVRHGLDPKLVRAMAYWESGWDQSRVSVTGAVGIMQVEPDTAAEAGPALLGRTVDLNDPYDNADVGAAVFRQYLDAFGSVAEALAAYNQGPTSLRANGMLPDTRSYVQGILDLAAWMDANGGMPP